MKRSIKRIQRSYFLYKTISFISLLGLMLYLSACLKTRAQLRAEDDNGSQKINSTVSSVESNDNGAEFSHTRETASANMKGLNDTRATPSMNQYAVDEIKVSLTQFEGRLEELEHAQQEGLHDKVRDSIKRIEERLVQLEQNQANLQANLATLNDTLKKLIDQGPSLGSVGSAGSVETHGFFDKVKSHLKSGKCELALQSLSQYLSNPKLKRVDEAIFLKAEAFYCLKQFKKAIVDYSKVSEKFSKSSFIPDSIYKIGLSFEALGLKEDAKGFFQDLVEKYPKSALAPKAKKKLKY